MVVGSAMWRAGYALSRFYGLNKFGTGFAHGCLIGRLKITKAMEA
jgi:hypothetical protein